jgi:cell division protein FtsZ
MNITGGSNLSLFEVQEAADLVASASDHELNMIFGSIINDNLKDEIMITVIATGFTNEEASSKRPVMAAPSKEAVQKPKREETFEQTFEQTIPDRAGQRQQYEEQYENDRSYQVQEDSLDIPTFLRNRNRRR